MSALGQKRTCAAHKPMSALHPIADMCGALGDVRFVPIADITASVPPRASLRMILLTRSCCGLGPLDLRRLPTAIEDRLIRPIGTEPDRKVSFRCRKPVGLLLCARRLVP